MGSSHKHSKLQSHIKMNTKVVLLFAFVCAASGRVFILDDAEFDTAPVYRVKEMLLHPTDLQLQPITQHQPIMDLQDVLVPSTLSSRPILRLTLSGVLDTGLELSMEDK